MVLQLIIISLQQDVKQSFLNNLNKKNENSIIHF